MVGRRKKGKYIEGRELCSQRRPHGVDVGDIAKFPRVMLRPPLLELLVEDLEYVLPERMLDVVDELPERLEESLDCVPDFYLPFCRWSFLATFTVKENQHLCLGTDAYVIPMEVGELVVQCTHCFCDVLKD